MSWSVSSYPCPRERSRRTLGGKETPSHTSYQLGWADCRCFKRAVISGPWPERISQISSRSQPELPIGIGNHDGKEAKRMAGNTTGRRQGTVSDCNGSSPASPTTVKVTLHLTVGTAQRLGVESAMRRISQSA